jgi:purine-binding chemotaxis protein CheW
VQALLVPVHDEWYAIELTRVREVVPAPAPTPLPGAPDALLGIFNLRGEVVPLFDTALLLGLPPGDAGDRVAVADTDRGPAGLLMHGRPDLVDLADEAGVPARRGAIGRYAFDGGRRVATLVDIDELLDEAVR